MWKRITKCYLILFILSSWFSFVQSRTYYFSADMGDDSRSWLQAQNRHTPWKTLVKLNSYMQRLQPGDSVLFNRGEDYYGSIDIAKSGNSSFPITFAAYGIGKKPTISGLTTLRNWVNMGTNLWETECEFDGLVLNNLLINGVQQQMGRYPNTSATNKGYLSIEYHNGNTQITDNQLKSTPNWTGAELVIRKNHWIIDKSEITNHNKNSLTYRGGSAYIPMDGWGYFIQNHVSTLDKFGEWFYNAKTKKMVIYSNGIHPSTLAVDITTVETLVKIRGSNYITIKDITFNGSNTATILLSDLKHVNIIRCDFISSGLNAIEAQNTLHCKLENNTIVDTKNNAIYFSYNCNYTTIIHNTISKTGLMAGGGKNSDDSYQALTIRGNNNLIYNNIIDSTGYIPIRFEESGNSEVKNNLITNFAMTKDDGGGIYSWRGCDKEAIPSTNKIIDNIIINGIGAPEGTNNINYRSVHGIYMDDNVANIEISGNTISNIAGSGIMLHNIKNITVQNNTLYNNNNQLKLVYDNCNAGFMRNLNLKNNILFSKTNKQSIIEAYSTVNDIASFGVFHSNYYCQAKNDSLSFSVNFKRVSFSLWEFTVERNIINKNILLNFPNFANSFQLEYNATQKDKVISLKSKYLDIKNKKYADTITLKPFSSIIIRKIKNITAQ